MSGVATAEEMTQVIVSMPNDAEMRQAFRNRDSDFVARRMTELTGVGIVGPQMVRLSAFGIRRAQLHPARLEGNQPAVDPKPDEEIEAALRGLVVVVEVPVESAPRYIVALRAAGLEGGAQAILAPFSHWVPSGDRPPIFHTRSTAEALIRAEATRSANLAGQRVNLVLCDEGFSRAALDARMGGEANYLGGWPVELPDGSVNRPGEAHPAGHGTMVALNAVSLAPFARLWDLPARPPRILDVVPFADFAAMALIWVEAEIRVWLRDAYPGPWVFCHPWGIYDRRLEVPSGGYTSDPQHILNRLFRFLDTDEGSRHDQVFAAGNGGQFAPHPRCGPGDIGPFHSILGGNSSPHVLTAGAVRADGLWIGYASQGPGQAEFATASGVVEKPDLCAPSQFCEADDGAWVSSGTSAACGVAAGAVAALRSEGSPLRDRSPEALRQHLRETALKPPTMAQTPYDLRFGHGILDLDAALQSLSTNAPLSAPQLAASGGGSAASDL